MRGRLGFAAGALLTLIVTSLFSWRPAALLRAASVPPPSLSSASLSEASAASAAAAATQGVQARAEQPAAAPPLLLPAAPPAAAGGPAWGSASTSPACIAALQAVADAPAVTAWPPECPLSAARRAAFEGPDGSMPITRDYCFAQRYEAGEGAQDWPPEYIDGYCARIAAGSEGGTYGVSDVAQAQAAFARSLPPLVGTTGMVLGTETPWLECIGLNAGAAAVWVWEYAAITTRHPRLRVQPVREIAAGYARGALQQVDWIAVYSSVEHSGLGRYGDALNPDGDRDAMLQAWCMLKPGGHLLLGVPATCTADGFIEFNAHRRYGFKRLAYIAQGYELVGYPSAIVGSTTIVVLRKPAGEQPAPPLTAADFAAKHAEVGPWADRACRGD